MTAVAKPAANAGPASNPPTSDPVLDALTRIERRLAEVERVTSALAPLADLVATAPGGLAMLTDTVDSLAARVEAPGELDARVRSVLRAVEVATKPRAVHGLATLIESDLLAPSVLAVLSQLASALSDPGASRPVGTIGVLRAMRDHDVQRALGFLFAVARTFGHRLAEGELEAAEQKLLTATASTADKEAA